MANSVAETVIGAVVLATAAGFVLYAGQTRGVQLGGESYPLTARFRSAEGISVGTDVRLAGIAVGSVTGLELDPQTFEAEASRVAPEWHGWLHHTWQDPPTEAPLPRQPWEKPHVPNLTGSDLAYRPPGSILSPAPQARSDYEAWAPE